MIKIEVHSTRAMIRQQLPLTVGLVGAQVEFSFGAEWSELSKTVVFQQNDTRITVANIGTTVLLPWEVLQSPGVPVQIGVYGVDARGTKVIPTVWVKTDPVKEGADPEGGPAQPYTPEVWEQILGQMGDLSKLKTADQKDLVSAVNEANEQICLVVITRQDDDTYRADRTFRELSSAIQAKKDLMCYWEDMRIFLSLAQAENDRLVFCSLIGDRGYFVSLKEGGGVQPSTVVIPKKVSQLENDAGYLTKAPVTQVNGRTGAVQIDALPNPHKLFISGMVDAQYDGSQEVNVKLPGVLYVKTAVSGNTITADMDYAQIKEAYEAGRTLVCMHSNLLLSLVRVNVIGCTFCAVYNGSVYTVTIMPTGVVKETITLVNEPVDLSGYATEQFVEEQVEQAMQTISEETPFAGKIAAFYGDSLTEVNPPEYDHYDKGYHQWVSELLGFASYNNYGRSGFTTAHVYQKVCSVDDTADVVFVMTGGNDQYKSVPLGVPGDETMDTIYGSFHLLCTALKRKYPTSVIVYITEPYQTNYPHAEGITGYEIAQAAKQVCEKFAITVYDNFTFSGMYPSNLNVFTTDNCHWNDKGHEMLGRNLAQFMKNTFQYVPGRTTWEVGTPDILGNSLDSAALENNTLTMTGGSQSAYGVMFRQAKKVQITNISDVKSIGWFLVGTFGNYRMVTAGAKTKNASGVAEGFSGEAYPVDITLTNIQAANREAFLFDPVESFCTMTAEVVDGVTHIYVDGKEFYTIEGNTIGYVVTAQKNATFKIAVE